MLRRIAGNCFWLGRYLERAENTARLAAAANARPAAGEAEPWPWIDALAIASATAAYHAAVGAVSAGAAAAFLLVDRANPSSVAQSLRAAGANARSARDLLGDGYWEAVNTAWIEADALDPIDLAARGIDEVAEWAIARCRLVRGAGEDLDRDELPQALAIGCAVERSDFILRLLAVEVANGMEEAGAIGSPGRERLEFALAAAAVRDTARRVHGGEVDAAQAIALLTFSSTCPRSALLNLARLEAALAVLAGASRSPALAEVSALRERLSLLTRQPLGDASALFGEIHLGVCAAAAAIERDHFAETAPPASPIARTGEG